MDLAKPRSTIEVSNNITTVQRIAYACILKHYFLVPKPKNQRFRGIPINDLCAMMGYEKKDFFYLDEQLEKLQKTLIKWKGDKKGEFTRVNFFSYVQLKDGVMYYDFHEVLQEHIKNKESLFNLLEINAMRLLKSKHAIALYEIVARYRPNNSSHFHYGSSFYLIEDMKDMLTGDPHCYPQFKDFNKRILKIAINEINEKSDLFIEPEFKRKGRSIFAVRFNVKNNESYNSEEKKAARIQLPIKAMKDRAYRSRKKKKKEEVKLEPSKQLDFTDVEQFRDFTKKEL